MQTIGLETLRILKHLIKWAVEVLYEISIDNDEDKNNCVLINNGSDYDDDNDEDILKKNFNPSWNQKIKI